MRFVCLCVCLLAAGPVSPAREQEKDGARIRVLEGAGAVVPRKAASPHRFLVAVTYADGRPAPGLTVTFRLPAEGATGLFASGLRTESMLSDERGQSFVRGIQWNDLPGSLEIQVSAVSADARVETAIPVEISASAPPSGRQSVSRPSSGRKWAVMAAVAGGAVAGLAVALGGKATSAAAAAAPAAVVVPPSIGSPTITVGRPQ